MMKKMMLSIAVIVAILLHGCDMDPRARLSPGAKESIYVVTGKNIEELRIEREWVDNTAWGGSGSEIMLTRKEVKMSELPTNVNGIYRKSWGKFVSVNAACAVVPCSDDRAAIYYIRQNKGRVVITRIEEAYLWDEYPRAFRRVSRMEKREKAGFVFL